MRANVTISKILFFIFLLNFLQFRSSKKFIFITAVFQNCNQTFCDGSLSYPYDSYFWALNNYNFVSHETYSIIFLGDSSTEHFLMLEENFFYTNATIPSSLSLFSYYSYKRQDSMTFGQNQYFNNLEAINLEMKPFYCDDEDFINMTNIDNLCIHKSQTPYLTLYLKSLAFQIILNGNLTISNLKFDGIETLLDGISICSTLRKSCCTTNFTACTVNLNNVIPQSLDALFEINITSNTYYLTWSIVDSIFTRIISSYHKSILLSGQYQIQINNTIFQDIFFKSGIISMADWTNYMSQSNTGQINWRQYIFGGYKGLNNNFYMNNNKAWFSQKPNSIIGINGCKFQTQLLKTDEMLRTLFDINPSTKIFMISWSNLIINNSIFEIGSSLIYSWRSNITINNSIFTGISTINLSDNVMQFELRANVYINNTKFLNFNGAKLGIQLISIKSGNNITLSLVTFTNNTINSSPMIYLDSLYSYFSSVMFINNNIYNGYIIQAINFMNDNQTIYLEKCLFNEISKNNINGITYIITQGYQKSISISYTKFNTGGTLYFSNIDQLIFNNIQYLDNSNNNPERHSIPIKIINVNSILINNSIFNNIYHIQGAISIDIASNQNLIFYNNSLKNNNGIKSGALTINFISDDSLSTNVKIDNCLFQNNFILKGNGAAMTLNNSHHVKISNTKFESNQAIMAGGAIYFNWVPPIIELDTVIFIGNEAIYGNDIASYPFRVIAITNDTHLPEINYDWENNLGINNYKSLLLPDKSILNYPTELQLTNLSSGDIVNQIFKFVEIDIYGQVIKTDNTSGMYINIIQESFDQNNLPPYSSFIRPYSSALRSAATSGVFDFSQQVINFWPGSNFTAIFKLENTIDFPDQLEQLISNNIGNKDLLAIRVDFSFKKCGLGEFFDRQYGTCLVCPPGSYSLDLKDNSISACIPCDNTIATCFGGALIGPKPRYWRKNITATIIKSCPQPEVCLGVTNLSDYDPSGKCASGYSGNLCSKCSNGYVFIENSCVNCEESISYYIWLFCSSLFQFLIIFYGVRYNIKMTLDSIEVEELAEQNIQYIPIILSNLLKILINYIQFASIIVSFLFNWPKFPLKLFSVYNIIGLNNYYSIDCFLANRSDQFNYDLVYMKTLIISMIPYAFIILATIAWLIYYYFKNHHQFQRQEFISGLVTTIVVAAVTFQYYMIKYSLLLFHCENLYRDDLKEYYLISDYNSQCFTNKHFFWAIFLGVPTFLIWALLLPAGVFLILYINRKNLREKRIKSKYSFLYRGYKENCYYWEFLIIYRKVILLIILVYVYYLCKNFQAMLVILIISLSLVVQIKIQPYQVQALNRLEEKCLICLFTMAIGGWYFLGSDGTENFMEWFAIALAILGNVVFICYWFYYYVYYQYKIGNSLVVKTVTYISTFIQNMKIKFHGTQKEQVIYISKNKIDEINQNYEEKNVPSLEKLMCLTS